MLQCCKAIKSNKYQYYNVVSKISLKKDFQSSSIVKCAINNKSEIMFMTRYPIPFNKNQKINLINTYRQTGIIAFTKESLLNFSKLNQNYFEKFESIDMLRILESGKKIYAEKVNKRMIGVDTFQDYKEVKNLI